MYFTLIEMYVCLKNQSSLLTRDLRLAYCAFVIIELLVMDKKSRCILYKTNRDIAKLLYKTWGTMSCTIASDQILIWPVAAGSFSRLYFILFCEVGETLLSTYMPRDGVRLRSRMTRLPLTRTFTVATTV